MTLSEALNKLTEGDAEGAASVAAISESMFASRQCISDAEWLAVLPQNRLKLLSLAITMIVVRLGQDPAQLAAFNLMIAAAKNELAGRN